MAVARQYQQPRRIILGDPLPAPGEPLWDDLSRDWAVAYEEYLAGVCSGCGTPHHVWDGAVEGELPFVGEWDSCRGCEEVADTESEIPEDQRKPWRRVVMVPGPVYDRRQELAEADEMLREHWQEVLEAADRLGLPRPQFSRAAAGV